MAYLAALIVWLASLLTNGHAYTYGDPTLNTTTNYGVRVELPLDHSCGIELLPVIAPFCDVD